MVYFKRLLGMAVLALGLSSAPSFAATLDIVGGQLMGAFGVNVGGTSYDVRFVDGTCVDLFTGCDHEFTFTSSADASVASQALLDQVFVDVPAGAFDTSPDLTNGITSSSNGYVFTPFGYRDSDFTVNFSAALNYDREDKDSFLNGNEPISADTSLAALYVYADWTIAAAVPLPAGGLLLLSALGGIAALRRRKKPTA